jgi:hypothetical protein
MTGPCHSEGSSNGQTGQAYPRGKKKAAQCSLGFTDGELGRHYYEVQVPFAQSKLNTRKRCFMWDRYAFIDNVYCSRTVDAGAIVTGWVKYIVVHAWWACLRIASASAASRSASDRIPPVYRLIIVSRGQCHLRPRVSCFPEMYSVLPMRQLCSCTLGRVTSSRVSTRPLLSGEV